MLGIWFIGYYVRLSLLRSGFDSASRHFPYFHFIVYSYIYFCQLILICLKFTEHGIPFLTYTPSISRNTKVTVEYTVIDSNSDSTNSDENNVLGRSCDYTADITNKTESTFFVVKMEACRVDSI